MTCLYRSFMQDLRSTSTRITNSGWKWSWCFLSTSSTIASTRYHGKNALKDLAEIVSELWIVKSSSIWPDGLQKVFRVDSTAFIFSLHSPSSRSSHLNVRILSCLFISVWVLLFFNAHFIVSLKFLPICTAEASSSSEAPKCKFSQWLSTYCLLVSKTLPPLISEIQRDNLRQKLRVFRTMDRSAVF